MYSTLFECPYPYLTSGPISPQEFEVTMTKGDKGLGFTVAGGQNTTGYFYVKDILFDPALSDGRIQKGDRLIKVRTCRCFSERSTYIPM